MGCRIEELSSMTSSHWLDHLTDMVTEMGTLEKRQVLRKKSIYLTLDMLCWRFPRGISVGVLRG